MVADLQGQELATLHGGAQHHQPGDVRMGGGAGVQAVTDLLVGVEGAEVVPGAQRLVHRLGAGEEDRRLVPAGPQRPHLVVGQLHDELAVDPGVIHRGAEAHQELPGGGGNTVDRRRGFRLGREGAGEEEDEQEDGGRKGFRQVSGREGGATAAEGVKRHEGPRVCVQFRSLDSTVRGRRGPEVMCGCPSLQRYF